MCGILGFIDKESSEAQGLLETQFPRISNRGILQAKHYGSGEAYGYVRLPTDDLDFSNEVIYSQGNCQVFLYNGILTNVDYLRDYFSLNCSDSDRAVFLEGFSKFGISFLKRCRGMFAAAFADNDKVTLVRDTVGIKPLYYVDSHNTFGFSSTLGGLTHPDINTRIKEVQPGEVVTYFKNQKTVIFDDFKFLPHSGYRKEDLQEALTDSLLTPTLRYLSHHSQPRIGLLLSGGLDSSILLKILVNNLSEEQLSRVSIFTIGYQEAGDVQNVTRLCKDLNLSFTLLQPRGEEESLDTLERIVFSNESKESRVARIGLLYDVLAEEIARQGIHVLIAGEGADELFYGYERFNDGLEDSQIDELYNAFIRDIFPRTLLQRFDRSFASHCIEGRVPFLDQEIVELSRTFSAREKVGSEKLYKLPLRKIAKNLGLPSHIFERQKVKMGVGATGQVNVDVPNGYLEESCQERFGISFSQRVRQIYAQEFTKQGKDVLENDPLLTTEEILTSWAAMFREKEVVKM